MIVILKKNILIESLMGLQKIDCNLVYRKSNFCHAIKLNKTVFLVYNTLTKQLLKLNEDEFNSLNSNEIIYKKIVASINHYAPIFDKERENK